MPQVPVFGTWVLGLVLPSAEFPMPVGLRRYYGKGYLHFITFSCYRRLPLLKILRARDIFVKETGGQQNRRDYAFFLGIRMKLPVQSTREIQVTLARMTENCSGRANQ